MKNYKEPSSMNLKYSSGDQPTAIPAIAGLVAGVAAAEVIRGGVRKMLGDIESMSMYFKPNAKVYRLSEV